MAYQIAQGYSLGGIETTFNVANVGNIMQFVLSNDGGGYAQGLGPNWEYYFNSNNSAFLVQASGSYDLGNGMVLNYPNCQFVLNGVELVSITSRPINSQIVFIIDTDNQIANIKIINRNNNGYTANVSNLLDTDNLRQTFYNWLKNQVPVLYNWQSVPSISGKNGILSLAQIKEEYIEGGEPTSSAEATCFDNLLRANKVAILIEASLPEPEIGGTTVTVSYLIEATLSGSYTYCKLVAKRNKIPNDVTDGDKIIDLDPTKTSVTIRNLRSLTEYYFIIFVKDSNDLEASSEPKSITTGENHDIVLFTDEFNTEILKSGWALDIYKSMFSNANTGWAPTSFASDFLSSYNFLCGNGSRRQLSMSNGELWTANETGMTDQTFWIPIERTYINESIVVSFDGKISPVGWSSSYYNYIHIWLAYVDDNNGWHSYNACGEIVTDQQWHNFEHEIQPQFPYIDYIGLCCCDGSSHWKNIKVINV